MKSPSDEKRKKTDNRMKAADALALQEQVASMKLALSEIACMGPVSLGKHRKIALAELAKISRNGATPLT